MLEVIVKSIQKMKIFEVGQLHFDTAPYQKLQKCPIFDFFDIIVKNHDF